MTTTTALPITSAADPNEHAICWVEAHVDQVTRELASTGAILLRGFDGTDRLGEIVGPLAGSPPASYVDRTSPRSELGAGRYTSTEHPSDQVIALHSENSYQATRPTHVAFGCEVSADTGGETIICDGCAVLEALPADLVRSFDEGVIYRRYFHPGLGLSWQEAFQIDQPDELAAVAERSGIGYEWEGSTLRTWHRRPLVGLSASGASAWANHFELFHPASLQSDLRTALTNLYGHDRLPLDITYPDGRAITDDCYREIATVTKRLSRRVAWEAGDVLIVDNLRMMHGRAPFIGRRRLLVSFAGEQPWEQSWSS